MEVKWYMIMVAALFVAISGAMAVDSKSKSDCKIAAIQAKASPDIVELCNKG